MKTIIDWANDNGGFVSLIALAISMPALFVLAYSVFRKLLPSKEEKRSRFRDEVAHAEELKRQIESNTEWDSNYGYYGEFLIRDGTRKLPETEETHSVETTPHSIVVLSLIHKEYLEFDCGCTGIKHIRQVADHWFLCDKDSKDSIKVHTIVRLNYRDIDFIQWETDEYWEWPQIFCRFTSSRKFPFSRVYYATMETGLPRFFFREICEVKDAQKSNRRFA